MKFIEIIPWLGSALTFVTSAVSDNELAQWILFGLGVLSAIMSLISSGAKLFLKWRQINQDGQISDEEIKGFDKAVDSFKKEIKEDINHVGNGKGDN